MKRILIFFIAILPAKESFSQYYITGSDPGSIKWEQIKTPHFRVIYPATFEEIAQHTANGLEFYRNMAGLSLNSNVKMTPVIMHNRTTIPSSVTPYAPLRMDFFTTPPQDTYAQDWIEQLIIHEYRHANQYAGINQGFTKVLSYVFGEQGTWAIEGIFLPLWFIEGDATVAETAFCMSGRGRVPSFEMRFRAQLLDKGIYSYEKAFNKSYKDMTPSPYEVGYQIVGMAREKYGADFWSRVLKSTGKKSYTLAPFSNSLKDECGMNKYDFYNSLAKELKNKWHESDIKKSENKFLDVTETQKRYYTNYNNPVFFRDSLVVAVKSSIDDLTKVVLIERNKNETTLFTTGVNFAPESLSASDSILYWSEMINDPRWTLRDYRVIKTFNLNTGRTGQLTRGSRYFSPSVTSDGSLIAAVEITNENKYFLVVLNSSDGSLVKRIGTPENLLFIHPRWSDDGKYIVSVVFGDTKGNGITVVDPENGKLKLVLPFTSLEIKRPSFFDHYIIYSASYQETENFFAVDTASHEVFQVTSSRFGATDASLNYKLRQLVYSNYTADGYDIKKMELEPDSWQKISPKVHSAFPLAEKLTEQENFIFQTDSVPKTHYPAKPYHKSLNLFNFHSWAPFGVNLENFSASPGLTILSQNLLGTSLTTLGYVYDRNMRTGKYYLQYSYEGYYPAIDLGADFGSRKRLKITSNGDTINESWKEWNISSALRLPLKWSHNYWIRSFQPSVGITFKNMNMDDPESAGFDSDQIFTLNGKLLLSNQMKTSYRDLAPRWGQEIRLNHIRTIDKTYSNHIFAGDIKLNFPGFLKHNSLELYAGYQKKIEDYYNFPDFIVFPLGYTDIFQNEIISLYANYSMPLICPDWQAGHFIYVKRIKSTYFYDFAESLGQIPHTKYSSTGMDIRIDLCLFNFILPFDLGLRTIYIPEKNDFEFRFLFGVSLNSLY